MEISKKIGNARQTKLGFNKHNHLKSENTGNVLKRRMKNLMKLIKIMQFNKK